MSANTYASARVRAGWNRSAGTVAAATALALVLVGLAPATTVSAAPVPAAAGTYQNGSDAITLAGEWDTSAATADSGGSVGFATGTASATLMFSGTSVSWISRTSEFSGVNAVKIDGAEVARVDRYSASTEHAVTTFASEALAAGVHTITVSTTGDVNDDSSGANLVVDAFVVTAGSEGTARQDAGIAASDDGAALSATTASTVPESAPTTTSGGIAAVGVYEGSSSAVRYSGRWSTLQSRSDSGGSSRYLNSTGSTSLTFTGRSVQWLSRLTPSAGIADVYLDGVKVASVDRYSSTTSYQQTVFSRSGLAAGSHTIKIAWTGRADDRSSGENLVVDAIVVPDVTAPVAPAGLTAARSGVDAVLLWGAVSDSGLVGYRVYARIAGHLRLIGQTMAGKTSFRSIGLPSRTDVGYVVTALDAWGNESRASVASTVRTTNTPSGSHRYEDCPAATKTVSSVGGFQKAVSSARPGTVIRLAAGVYPGQLEISADGTAADPIWICGSRDVKVDGGGLSVSSPIDVSGSSHVIVTGMTLRNALKGVTVRASDHITISDLLVENIGYEGIHLRSRTTDSTVVGNTVRRTGRLDPFYGEGIYIGSSKNNWCALTSCAPDRSDRNAVLDNSVSLTGSDLIEAKEGTTGGLIAGNDLDGTGGMSRTESWLMVSGNDWVVIDNTARESSEHGFRINGDMPGWGLRSVFSENIGRVEAPGFGFKLWEPDGDGTSRTVLACDNIITDAGAGFSNVDCTY